MLGILATYFLGLPAGFHNDEQSSDNAKDGWAQLFVHFKVHGVA